MWNMSINDLSAEEEEAIRQRVEARLEARREFYEHLGRYVAVNLTVWVVYLASGATGSPWPLWVTLGWGFGIMGHAWDYWTTHGPGHNYTERQTQAEIAREMAAYYDEKRKNDIYVHEPVGIGPDGELLYADDFPLQQSADGNA